jgi:hypothetical protein
MNTTTGSITRKSCRLSGCSDEPLAALLALGSLVLPEHAGSQPEQGWSSSFIISPTSTSVNFRRWDPFEMLGGSQSLSAPRPAAPRIHPLLSGHGHYGKRCGRELVAQLKAIIYLVRRHEVIRRDAILGGAFEISK